jgi:hypothetical protein
MSNPTIHLPDPDVLIKQLKEQQWVDFYTKIPNIIGSVESHLILQQELERLQWQEQHTIGGDETTNEKS